VGGGRDTNATRGRGRGFNPFLEEAVCREKSRWKKGETQFLFIPSYEKKRRIPALFSLCSAVRPLLRRRLIRKLVMQMPKEARYITLPFEFAWEGRTIISAARGEGEKGGAFPPLVSREKGRFGGFPQCQEALGRRKKMIFPLSSRPLQEGRKKDSKFSLIMEGKKKQVFFA